MVNSSTLGSDMKKFFVFIGLVVLATVAMILANDALNSYLIFSSSNSNPYKMYRLFTNPEKGEIPILGSSRAEAGFAPLELSEHAFNYGLSGSSARETALHLKAVLSREGGGLVIVNLDPWGLGNGRFRGKYLFVADNPIVKSEPKIKLPLIEKVVGARFHGETRANLSEFMNNRLAVTKTMERGAILQRLSRNEEEWAYIISKCEASSCSCNDETRKMLGEILASNTRYEVVFVVSPIAKPWWDRFVGHVELAEIEQWLCSFPHVHVIDRARTSDGYDLSEFMDLTHLNEKGARRFTKEIKVVLRDLGLL